MLAPTARRVAALAIVPALAAAIALVAPARAAGPEVSIEGASVVGDTATVTGSASLPGESPLVVDAGDSAFAEIGDAVPLSGMAFGSTGPYTFAWSIGGSTSAFDDPTLVSPVLDTSGIAPGVVAVDLAVTDGVGRTVPDSVLLSLYEITEQRVLDAAVAVGPGLPEEVVDGEAGTDLSGTVDGQSRAHLFTVPLGTGRLRLELSWETHVADPTGLLLAVNDLDLYVDDPSDAQDDNATGATAAMPETIDVANPAAGDWSALVRAFLNAPDTYRIIADATSAPPSNPLPRVTTPGPFRFEAGQPQAVSAAVTGGAAPLTVAWDLDFDGVYETPGIEITTAFPIGEHFVSVKVTDAAGYETREATAVSVVETGTPVATTPLVVIGVSDTGINPYHDDFAASSYPDPRVLELTRGFTRHPSEYIPGYPAGTPALDLTLGAGYKPPADDAIWTRGNIPLDTLFWIPGTKIIGAIDAGDSKPVNGAADTIPILDEDGHGTASASVAAGNIFGFCRTCLLVFGEDFDADQFMYSQSWIDMTSNSFGSAANAGGAGQLGPAAQPRERAEDGQLALYAAGNGVDLSFIVPEQTYTAETLGADWLIRVGAVDRKSRQPVIGTGKPVDVASWGMGPIPSAAHDSDFGVVNHSGTSAATPYTAGVFGTVLSRVREVLGDRATGARGHGVLATGSPVPGSPALGDGVLTRAELQEAVFKTAEHDTDGNAVTFPLTSPPLFPAQHLMEGYGIVEPASGARALAVLLGDAPMPERPTEDEFFERDEALRDALWGDWNDGDGIDGNESSAGALPGTTPQSIGTFDDALAVLDAAFGEAVGDATAASAVDRWFAHRTGPCSNTAADTLWLDRVDSPGDNDTCGTVGTAALVGADVASWSSTVTVSHAVPAGATVSGHVFLQSQEPNVVSMRSTLVGDRGLVGQASSEAQPSFGAVDRLDGYWLDLPFAITTDRAIDAGEHLTLAIGLDSNVSWIVGYEGDHATHIDLPAGGGPVDPPPSGLFARIDEPVDGSVVDPVAEPELTVLGAFGVDAAPATSRRYFPHQDDCGSETPEIPNNPRLSSLDFPEASEGSCGYIPGASAYGKVIDVRNDYPLVRDELPITLAAGSATGVVYIEAEGPSPLTSIDVEISTRGVPLGRETAEGAVVGFPVEGPVAFPFSIALDGLVGSLPELTFSIIVNEAQGGIFFSLDGAGTTTYVDLPVVADEPAASVQVSVDDPTFAAPILAETSEERFAAAVDTTVLADGPHTIYARAVDGSSVSATDSVTIVVERSATLPVGPVVQVQAMPTGDASTDSGWVDAVDTSAAGDWSSWTADVPLAGPAGDYEIVARLIDGSEVAAVDGPVVVTKP